MGLEYYTLGVEILGFINANLGLNQKHGLAFTIAIKAMNARCTEKDLGQLPSLGA